MKHCVNFLLSVAYANPQSTLSSTSSAVQIRDAIEAADLSLESLKIAGKYVYGTAIYNEQEVDFLRADGLGQNMIRGQAGLCVAWLPDKKIFCREKAATGLDTCVKHKDQAKPDLMKVIMGFGKAHYKSGFHIMKGMKRWNLETLKSANRKEYCPSLKGANAAFNDSADNFGTLLEAASEVYDRVKVKKQDFSSAPFKDRFPDADISDHKWYHTFLALNVSMFHYLL